LSEEAQNGDDSVSFQAKGAGNAAGVWDGRMVKEKQQKKR
jgi:hypothetical protein